MSELRWLWRARLDRVIDGDTVDMYLDTGFHTVRKERIRLAGINAPEIEKDTKEAGTATKNFVQDWMDRGSLSDSDLFPFVVETFKSDSFGRYLGKVWWYSEFVYNRDDISKILLNNNLAIPFNPRS